MKTASLVLAVLAALSGFWAAYRWYLASKVDFVPFVEDENGRRVPAPAHEVHLWINAVLLTLQKSGPLNKSAAIWTALHK
jgi:hypothetical protein